MREASRVLRRRDRLRALRGHVVAPPYKSTTHLMELEPMSSEVKELISKAAKTDDALQAMQFSQAAVNAANALRQVADTEANAKK